MNVAMWVLWIWVSGMASSLAWLAFRLLFERVRSGDKFALMTVVVVSPESPPTLAFLSHDGTLRRGSTALLPLMFALFVFALGWPVTVPGEIWHNHRARTQTAVGVPGPFPPIPPSYLTGMDLEPAEDVIGHNDEPTPPVAHREGPWPPVRTADDAERERHPADFPPVRSGDRPEEGGYLDAEFGPDTGGNWRGPRSGG